MSHPRVPVPSPAGRHGWPASFRRLPVAARRVRERPPVEEDLLSGATALPPLPDETLAVVARALAEAGHVVFVRDDADGRRLLYAARSRGGGRGEWRQPEAAAGSAPRGWGRYEDEGCQRLALGSVHVSDAAWWSASLAVPIGDGGTVLVSLRRHGAPAPLYAGDPSVELVLPAGEVERVATLITGVVAQARRDGVLAARPADDVAER